MSTGRRRRLFGPLFYGALALASLVLLSLGLWELWPTWRQHGELRSLVGDLRSSDPIVYWHAADGLERAGRAGVPWLVEAARDRDASVRLLAVSALGRTMPLPRSAIPTLIAGLCDEDVRIRRQAADALARFGPEAEAAADDLTRSLEDEDRDVRFRAARALVKIRGRASEPAMRQLLALIADPVVADLHGRTAVVDLLRRMGPEEEARAVAVLIPGINAEDRASRHVALEGLGRLGPRAREAIPALEVALQDEDLVVRYLAALALSEIEGWTKGWARLVLEGLVNRPELSANMRNQVRWVVQSDLVNGSEYSQPVYMLRALVEEFRWSEAQARLNAVPPTEDDATRVRDTDQGSRF